MRGRRNITAPPPRCLGPAAFPASRWAVALALALLAPTVLAGQSITFDTLDVTVVTVDVVVTDKDGNPVRGLGRDDFAVFEDGDPVAITNFSAIQGGTLLLAPDLPSDPATAPPAAPEREAAPPLTLMILIDSASIQPQNRNRLIDEVEGALDLLLRPGDRAMVAESDGEVDLLCELTADRAELSKALHKAAKGVGRAAGVRAEFGYLVRELELGQSESDARSMFSGIRNFASARLADAARSAGAMREWVNSLAALPGRKAVLMLSDGHSRFPAQALYDAWERKFGSVEPRLAAQGSDLRMFDATAPFTELADHANANRVTFYAIAGENRSFSSTSAEVRGLDGFGNRVWTPALESIEESNLRGSLETMAEATGGRVGIGVNALRSMLGNLRRDFDDYYSLAYSPPGARSGRTRDIEVRFASPRPGLRLRFREGYRDKTLEERLDDQAVSTALLGEGLNPLEVEMKIGDSIPAGKGLVDTQVAIRFPMRNVVLIPNGAQHEGRLLVSIIARDEKGRLSPPVRVAIPVAVPSDQLESVIDQYAGWATTMRLRTGDHRIGVAVRDLVGAVDSAISMDAGPRVRR